jgi:hypothetical protein
MHVGARKSLQFSFKEGCTAVGKHVFMNPGEWLEEINLLVLEDVTPASSKSSQPVLVIWQNVFPDNKLTNKASMSYTHFPQGSSLSFTELLDVFTYCARQHGEWKEAETPRQ